ncbi:retropepsin-like aspartic protease family protein [Alteromonas sp. CYL-A6]|uniref:retropepsin-like aspartic protease family protein n=1 Tax=Alteromonas nitratireducens TaxID=3390813 RepID=UPI0034BBFC6E
MLTHSALAEDFSQQVTLERSDANTLYVSAVLDNRLTATFMVDTGASIIILNQQTFDALKAKGASVEFIGQLGARLANGHISTVKRYQIASLTLGTSCQFSNVEVAVMPNKNNILGMNLLMNASPFAIFTSPPRLALSRCDLMASAQ